MKLVECDDTIFQGNISYWARIKYNTNEQCMEASKATKKYLNYLSIFRVLGSFPSTASRIDDNFCPV